jgi:hypothetical protein
MCFCCCPHILARSELEGLSDLGICVGVDCPYVVG